MKVNVDIDKILKSKNDTYDDYDIIDEDDNVEYQDVLEEMLYLLDKKNKMYNVILESSLGFSDEYAQGYYEYNRNAYKMFLDDNDITLEQFIKFIKDTIKYEDYNIALEAGNKFQRKVQKKVEKGLRKVNNKINGTKNTVSKNMKRLDNKASDIVNRKLDDIINTGREIKREKIIEGRSSIKISRFVKNALIALGGAVGSAALFGPAASAVIVALGLRTRKALMTKTEEREKKRILHDLETELQIAEEKMKDAESENDRKKKYELMRIIAGYKKEINRIKYNQRFY